MEDTVSISSYVSRIIETNGSGCCWGNWMCVSGPYCSTESVSFPAVESNSAFCGLLLMPDTRNLPSKGQLNTCRYTVLLFLSLVILPQSCWLRLSPVLLYNASP